MWKSAPKKDTTVEPCNSKLVNSKQPGYSKLILAAFQTIYNINHLLNSKLLAKVNHLLFLKKFTITRFDCTKKDCFLSAEVFFGAPCNTIFSSFQNYLSFLSNQ